MVMFDKEIKLVISECYTKKKKKRHTDISLFILHNTGLLIFFKINKFRFDMIKIHEVKCLIIK